MPRIFIIISLGLAAVAPAERVHLEYTAIVQTVRGDAFGLMVPRLTEVTGCFGYDTNAIDSSADLNRGNYENAPGGYFLARILGNTISGSSGPFLQVENFNPDTFRFIDGDEIFDRAGDMSLNGVLDGDIKLQMAITDSAGLAFDDDDLPAVFPFRMPGPLADSPHTFALSDSPSDLLLLQFTSLVQVQPPTLQIRQVALSNSGQNAEVHWISKPDESYTLQWSIDGSDWDNVATGIPSQGYCSMVIDTLATRFPGGVPEPMLYRVIREP